MNTPKIELLIGMIASGKSTYALRRAREGALVVSHDALTAMLHAEYRYEQGLRSMYRDMEEKLAASAIFHGRDVVVDRTHLTLESRGRWISFGAYYNWPVVAVEFPIVEANVHAIRRHDSDARGRSFDEWLMVARHHAKQAFAEPLGARREGFHGHLKARWEDGRVVVEEVAL